MEDFTKVAVIALLTVLFLPVIKRHTAELGVVLSLAACVLIGLFLVNMARPVVAFFSELRAMTGLDRSLMEPLMKTLGVGLLSQLCAGVCSDAGESALAKLVELAGSVLSIYLALPLFRAVIELVQTMGGG